MLKRFFLLQPLGQKAADAFHEPLPCNHRDCAAVQAPRAIRVLQNIFSCPGVGGPAVTEAPVHTTAIFRATYSKASPSCIDAGRNSEDPLVLFIQTYSKTHTPQRCYRPTS